MDAKWETGVGGVTDLESCQLMGTVVSWWSRYHSACCPFFHSVCVLLPLPNPGFTAKTESLPFFFFLLSVKLVEQVDEGRILPNEFAEKDVAALQSVIDLLTGRRLS